MNQLPPITPEGTWTQPAKHGRVLEYLTPDGRRVQVRLWTFAEGVINGQPADLPCPMADEEVHGFLLGALERTAAGNEEMVPQNEEEEVKDNELYPETLAAAARCLYAPPHTFLAHAARLEIQRNEARDLLRDHTQAGVVTANKGGTLGTTGPTIRRVLFLDVDGVLNTRPGSLDEDKLEFLRHLIVMSGASVVVSSSWRTVPEQYERLLKALAGIGVVPIGCTPDLTDEPGVIYYSPRCGEINAWLNRNPQVDQFVILDDLRSMGPLGAHHVWIDPEFGLMNKNNLEALVLFERQAQAKGDMGPWMPGWAGKEAA